ncbi:MAG: TIGR00730 family Rossman fold protein [Hylemonella sp.]|uniref:LOG family protein n=1 Tax=Hylemonella sp. TaxID=2066020 RepID=UPI0022CB7307|nr:TIGR00730 family Rossman fold protein [Hylemonella sp.]MCZ8251818.1 TIGR00730 family Rossman fold protein [Hylemonella sp.]
MKTPHDLSTRTLADAWADLKAHADAGIPLQADAYRLAFADPEFLLRRETRGIRFQLELLKPDLEQQAQGVTSTIVVFGSARFVDAEEAQRRLAAARAGGDARALAQAERDARNAQYYEQARRFGRLVAEHSAKLSHAERLYICTGGGPGIMEAANRGAYEAGALNVGLNIALPHEQSGNRYISPSLCFKFHYFALRKMHFMMRAKALVAFPGGFGTLDELFEILTLVQTGKSEPVPVVLFGSSFWQRLINFDLLVEEGVISPEDTQLFKLVDTPEAAWDAIQSYYRLGAGPAP